MNAGGTGGSSAMALTKAGVTEIFASNVLGHARLLEGLIAADALDGLGRSGRKRGRTRCAEATDPAADIRRPFGGRIRKRHRRLVLRRAEGERITRLRSGEIPWCAMDVRARPQVPAPPDTDRQPGEHRGHRRVQGYGTGAASADEPRPDAANTAETRARASRQRGRAAAGGRHRPRRSRQRQVLRERRKYLDGAASRPGRDRR